MPLFKYILLALLGSSGTTLLADIPITPPSTTLDGDAIIQPHGGALSSVYLGQDTPPKKSGRREKELRKRRHHSKVYHHPVKQPRTPKKEG